MGTMHAQHFLIAERERSIYDSCRFDNGRFRAEPTNYERCLHLSDKFAYRTQYLVPYATRNPQVKNMKLKTKKVTTSNQIRKATDVANCALSTHKNHDDTLGR